MDTGPSLALEPGAQLSVPDEDQLSVIVRRITAPPTGEGVPSRGTELGLELIGRYEAESGVGTGSWALGS